MQSSATVSNFDFKVWEKVLIAVSVLLFLISFYLYVTDFPLRRYLFNIEDVGQHRQVGKVAVKRGVLRRQLNGESEFKVAEVENPLYDEDTVVTGSDSGATLQLDDESTIELAPNTMVRLRFESGFGLGGISRAASVDLVAGDVKGDAKRTSIVIRSREKTVNIRRDSIEKVSVAQPVRLAVVPVPIVVPAPVAVVTPKPSPVPTVDPAAIAGLELVSPVNGLRLSLEKGATLLRKTATVEWRVSPPDRKVLVTLVKLTPSPTGGASRRREIYHSLVADVNGRGRVSRELDAPGVYEWNIKGSKGEPIKGAKVTHASFFLDPNFEAIDILDPLVGGQLMRSSRLQDKQLTNFDITLRWKPHSQAQSYRIAIKSQPTDLKPVLERVVAKPEYIFNKNRVYNGQIYYQVFAPLQNGFLARSAPSIFNFSFLAPEPVTPTNHAVLSRAKLLKKGDGVLLTWQKTNFTDFYMLEISQDASFKSDVEEKKLKENFFPYMVSNTGRYYWRVRSSSASKSGANVMSPPSAATEFSIAP